MNSGASDVQRVHDDRPQVPRTITDDIPAPVNARIDDDRASSLTSSVSAAGTVETVIRWQTPPSRVHTPQPSARFLGEHPRQRSNSTNEGLHASNVSLVVRFDENQIKIDEVDADKKVRRMDNASMDSEPLTPGTDNTPYIRFAIDQLTREQDMRRSASGRSSDLCSAERIIPNHLRDDHLRPGWMHTREERALARRYRSSLKTESESTSSRLFGFNATRPLSDDLPVPVLSPMYPDIFIPIEPPEHSSRYPDLTFVPTILRPLSMITITILCLLMITAIMFCAIFSTYDSLEAWTGVYGGQYFLFRLLPQTLSAVLVMVIHGVMRASRRILPYTLMAMDDAESRSKGLFLDICQKSFLWPRWDCPTIINVANCFFWLSMFTIPLQSCLFSALYTGGVWRWTVCQGVAWTLIAIYVFVLIGVCIVGLFFHRRVTGLMWDPRSLADMVALLPKSNCLGDYSGTDIMGTRKEIRNALNLRSDRLGYWTTRNRHQGIFYCLGEEGASTHRYTLELGRVHEKSSIRRSSDLEKSNMLYDDGLRFHYIPWYLRDTFVIFWCVTAAILLIALFIVSFLPSTAIRKGFAPRVSPVTSTQGFSAADFLYSFIPSLLGLLLYLFFQSLDMSLRQLQPWAELGKGEGRTANQSLLLDYTSRFSLGCTWSAFYAGHYRVAIVSLSSFFHVLIPVLAGGLFFALTTPSGSVRMIPNLTVFYILLTSLTVYAIGLLCLIPDRRLLHLPHAIDCLAEIFSFIHNSQMLDDGAFRAPRTRADLIMRLMSVRAGGREARYELGVHQGRNGEEWMGIERVGRDGHRRQFFSS